MIAGGRMKSITLLRLVPGTFWALNKRLLLLLLLGICVPMLITGTVCMVLSASVFLFYTSFEKINWEAFYILSYVL